MLSVLVFAGTADGRELAERAARLPVQLTVSVATDYGYELLLGLPDSCRVVAGRRDAAAMAELMRECGCALVVDATHPYAVEASRAIARAAATCGVDCLRLVRHTVPDAGAAYVDSPEAAAAALAETAGNILLTTGSSRLDAFTAVPNFAERCYPRVLPTEEALRQCLALGYRQSHVIAMQGPFGVELNAAMMRHFAIRHLVTKDGGAAGGFPDKLRAAAEAGVRTLVVGRPATETGLDRDGVLAAIRARTEGRA